MKGMGILDGDSVLCAKTNVANNEMCIRDRKWGSAASYDLCINSSAVGIEGAVDMILDFVKKKEEQKVSG